MTLREYDLVSGLIRFFFSLQLQKRMLSKREAEGRGGGRCGGVNGMKAGWGCG